ncbi:MAG: cupin domain-containing protein [Candidatus Marinimicrobia bacterium]|nr:cupin domain-containing protein [Candidatus Neomarinimicrobiota bacterium]
MAARPKLPERFVGVGQLPWHDILKDGRLMFQRQFLGRSAGATQFGASLYLIPPGGQLWTYHYHHAEEEAIYVLEGKGSVRLPAGKTALQAGDYLALPVGPDGAHLVLADAGEPLRLLAVSTLHDIDVVSHPDSGKIGVFSRQPLKTSDGKAVKRMFLHTDSPVSIWSGEKEDHS